MESETFARKLHGRAAMVGTVVGLQCPEITEILSKVGFDWLFIDMEHGTIGFESVNNLLRAAGSTPCLLRLPSMDEVWIKKGLDSGAAGIILPLIRSAKEAETAVSLAKYPPEGNRSVGIGRACDYGLHFNRYLETANRSLAVVLQIEHIDAVRRIDEIAAVPGIDAFFIGPYDLSASMGVPGRTDAAEVLAAVETIRQSASAANIPLGIFTPTAESAADFINKGFTLLAVSTETLMLAQAAQRLLEKLG